MAGRQVQEGISQRAHVPPNDAGGGGLPALAGYRPDRDKDFDQKKDVDPSRLPVVDIDQAGCIEAFALLNRADNEIAQDYVTDRTANRDQIFPLLRRIRGPASATTDGIPVTTSFVLPELPPSTQFLYQGSQNYPAETLQAVFLPGVHIQCL